MSAPRIVRTLFRPATIGYRIGQSKQKDVFVWMRTRSWKVEAGAVFEYPRSLWTMPQYAPNFLQKFFRWHTGKQMSPPRYRKRELAIYLIVAFLDGWRNTINSFACGGSLSCFAAYQIQTFDLFFQVQHLFSPTTTVLVFIFLITFK